MLSNQTLTQPSEKEAILKMWLPQSPNTNIKTSEREFKIRFRAQFHYRLNLLTRSFSTDRNGANMMRLSGSAAKNLYRKTRRKIRDGNLLATSDKNSQNHSWRQKSSSGIPHLNFMHQAQWLGWFPLLKRNAICLRRGLRLIQSSHRSCSAVAVPAVLQMKKIP